MKPYSPACENNKDPILAVLREVFTAPGLILEIGSGTGQHAAYLPRFLPPIVWQPSDLAENLPGIRLWLEEAALTNVNQPLELDVAWEPWPIARAEGAFSANTAHIMSWPQVERMFRGIGRILAPGGYFCLYGPFSYAGRHTSPSNARFDAMLKRRDPLSGIRDVSDLERLAREAGLEFIRDYPMPANNRTLVWRKALED